MGAQGTTILDFGATPSDTASVVVTGQTGIAGTSHVEAFFMADTTVDNGADEHEEADALCGLVCGSIVAGVGFTINAHALAALGTGTFTIRWVWN
jgi:hypothetical protein